MSAQIHTLDNHIANGVIISGKNTWMQTWSGNKVSILDPQIEDIDIDDIINSISKLCRFNGQCSIFYSVAQHCVEGSHLAGKLFGEDIAREFLLHDATEAYVGDMIRPLKVHDKLFQEIEERFYGVIARRFNFPFEMTQECKYIDDVMVTWEKRDIMPNSDPWPNLPDITEYNFPKIEEWRWTTALRLYKERYRELFRENITS